MVMRTVDSRTQYYVSHVRIEAFDWERFLESLDEKNGREVEPERDWLRTKQSLMQDCSDLLGYLI